MRILSSKKSETTVAIIIIAVIALIAYVSIVGSRECRTNRDCGKGSYCGSDFACHEFPVVEKESSGNLVLPAIILGASMIIAALIFKSGKIWMPKKRFGKEGFEGNSSEDFKSP